MKKWTTIIAVILVLAVVGIYFYSSENSKNVTNKTNSICIGERGQNDSCWTELAVKNKDTSLCNNVSGNYRAGNVVNCLKEVYISKGDENSCGLLYSSGDRMDCYYQISKTKSSSICNSIENISQNECNLGILVYETIDRATTTRNQTLCEVLTGDSMGYKEQCLTSVFVEIGDVNLCNQLTDYKEGCIYQIQNK